MNRKRTKLLLLVIAASLCFGTLIGISFVAMKTVAWVRDLPNRIDIQINSEAFGLAITESIRGELLADSTERQLNAIECLSNGLSEGPETQTWIHSEYGDEITSLTDSADQEVATAASMLMESLHANTQPAADL